ncbi:hypothetical protein MKX03_022401 [Papaver bracteatum]|nr:hypothetical protein MKX03_022401 [Papaver bracteatum]
MATASLLRPCCSLGRESNSSINVNPLLKTRTQIHYQLVIKNKSFLIKQRPETNNFRVQCFMKSNKAGFGEEKAEEKDRRKGNSLDEIIQEILKTLNIFIQKTAIAGVILGLLMTTYNPHLALAASGGRMGGSSFSSSSSSWNSYSSSSDDDNSYSYSSRNSYSSSPSYWSSSIDWSTPKNYYSSQTSSPSEETEGEEDPAPEAQRLTALEVALLGATRSLQKDLDKIAEIADTSTTSGLSYILQESTVALIRHLAYCFSSYSSVDVKPDKVDGEKLFNQLTIEERAKFEEETLVNVDNIKKKSTPSKKPNGLSSDYIVMTILVAAMGDFKLGDVNNSDDLGKALQKLGSISTSKILAVEVMWTPQEENDTLTEREMLEDYPRLKPL